MSTTEIHSRVCLNIEICVTEALSPYVTALKELRKHGMQPLKRTSVHSNKKKKRKLIESILSFSIAIERSQYSL